MDRWQGYLPVSNASLLLTFERAAQRGVQFSPAERALFLACEFWTAVAGRKLAAYLGANPLDSLRYMSIVYSGIRAHGVTSALFVCIGELESASHPQARYSCVAALQERLLKTTDPVDQLITHLAEKLGLGAGGQVHWIDASDMLLISA
jgi:hypothetical protein